MTVWNPQRQAKIIVERFCAIGEREASSMPPLEDGDRDRRIRSRGTKRNYLQAVKLAAIDCRRKYKKPLDALSKDQARDYLERRATQVGDKTLSQDRLGLELLPKVWEARHDGPDLSEIKSMVNDNQKWDGDSRAHTLEQLAAIRAEMNPRDAFSIEVGEAGGLRSHEFLTLARADEQPATDRDEWKDERFDGYEDPVFYTVIGKGGLIRKVPFERELADRIEQRRWPNDKRRDAVDRGEHYATRYDLAGGNTLSKAFERASERVFRESLGLHSLRHSFAQTRMSYHMDQARTRDEALELVSQQLGHFRPSITLTYLR